RDQVERVVVVPGLMREQSEKVQRGRKLRFAGEDLAIDGFGLGEPAGVMVRPRLLYRRPDPHVLERGHFRTGLPFRAARTPRAAVPLGIVSGGAASSIPAACARVVAVIRCPPIISANSSTRSAPSMMRTVVCVSDPATCLRTVRCRS